MTIYRLNRVPDKLHVTLLELLGIQLDGPSAAAHRRALPPRRARPTEPLLIPGGETEVGTPRTAARRVDRLPGPTRLHDPARRARPPTCSSAAGQIKDVGVADGEARPQGADQLPFGNPPPSATRSTSASTSRSAGCCSDRRRRLAGPRRRRQPRGPAAALGGLPGRQRLGRGDRPRGPHRRLQLRRRRGRAAAAAALGGAAARRPPHALAALPDRRQDPPRRRRDDVLAGAGDLLAQGRADRRAAARAARRAGGERDARRLRRHARARRSRCASTRCSSR